MDTLPLVTIGIPNYNYAHYIIDALESVVNQTYSNIEFIIVDDCSIDNSVEIIEKWIRNYNERFKITFIKNASTIGISRVCNIILTRASGKYFQILDADDMILADKIKIQVQQFEKDGKCSLVYSNIGIINEENQVINNDYLGQIGYDRRNMPQGNVFKDLLMFNFVPNPSVLIKTDDAKEIGGYDESLQVQDYYLYLTLSERYNFIYSNEVTSYYRIHSDSLSNSNKTNPNSIEGSLTLLCRYYENGDDKFKAHVKKSIFNMAPYFYKHRFQNANYWIKRNATLNPGFKSIGYLVAFYIGIPYSFFDKLKSIFHFSNVTNAK